MELQALLEQLRICEQRLDLRGLIAEKFGKSGFLIAPDPHKGEIDLLIMTVVHGNEYGSLAPVLAFLEHILNGPKLEASIGVLVCHPEAARRDLRFIEKDLNRCFGMNDHVSLEGRIALQLEPIILRSKMVIDLHQTNYETKSDFFIFPDNPSNIAFAAQIGGETPIITHGLDFSSDGFTSDTFATVKGVTAITYEMGQIGKTLVQIEKTVGILERAFFACTKPLDIALRPPQTLRFSQVIKSSTQKQLIPDLINLAQVKKGDVLGYDVIEGAIHAQHDGFVLFPKYGVRAEKSSELCHVVRSVPELQL